MANKKNYNHFDSYVDEKGRIGIVTNEWDEFGEKQQSFNIVTVERAKQIISDLQDCIKRLEKD